MLLEAPMVGFCYVVHVLALSWQVLCLWLLCWLLSTISLLLLLLIYIPLNEILILHSLRPLLAHVETRLKAPAEE